MGPEFTWEPEMFGFTETLLHLPRQDYYRYLFGFRILPLGSWPLPSSYAAFYFCMKSILDLGGAGMGVVTQVPDFAAFQPEIMRCSRTFALLLHGFNTCTLTCGTLGNPMRPRLNRGLGLAKIGGLWRPDPARIPL
ncbi:hypothetical protein F2Q68_00016353 [Brassica cretica]|uniref:Uncharacterized protein n=1 Tax=Brassica cretica TaxID=69181 RepID=A0A8S9HH20_BRACR|nr:hypothetical protein F2Q68_00016353 [Brassica cretica]